MLDVCSLKNSLSVYYIGNSHTFQMSERGWRFGSYWQNKERLSLLRVPTYITNGLPVISNCVVCVVDLVVGS